MPNCDPLQDVAEELKDPEIRRLYGTADAKTALAMLIAAIAKEQGLTASQMAEAMGITIGHFDLMLRGEANFKLGVLGSMLANMGLRLVLGVEPLVPRGEK